MTGRRQGVGVTLLLGALGVLGVLGAGAVGVGLVVGVTALVQPGQPADPPGRPDDAGVLSPGGERADGEVRGRERSAATAVAREVLREWDLAREAAWVTDDPRALARLYLDDAVAGRRDVRLLRRWSARGARVTRLQPQLLELRVLRDVGRSLVVQVTDRLAVEATVDGEPVALPHDATTTRRIELRRGPGVASPWRVGAVGDAAGRASALPPPASLEE